jgi:hypothetical protein
MTILTILVTAIIVCGVSIIGFGILVDHILRREPDNEEN